jgi:hypothetical protein
VPANIVVIFVALQDEFRRRKNGRPHCCR